jgi:hypothetical protein
MHEAFFFRKMVNSVTAVRGLPQADKKVQE